MCKDATVAYYNKASTLVINIVTLKQHDILRMPIVSDQRPILNKSLNIGQTLNHDGTIGQTFCGFNLQIDI
jgi:hypothetical protein